MDSINYDLSNGQPTLKRTKKPTKRIETLKQANEQTNEKNPIPFWFQ